MKSRKFLFSPSWFAALRNEQEERSADLSLRTTLLISCFVGTSDSTSRRRQVGSTYCWEPRSAYQHLIDLPVLHNRQSVASALFFDVVSDIWTFTSGSSFTGKLWTFTDIHPLVQASITLHKAEDHRDQLWSPGRIQGLILPGLPLRLRCPTCCIEQGNFIDNSSRGIISANV